VDALKQFISYRTVSSDPRYQADCRRGASHLRSVLKNFGAQTSMLVTSNPQWNPIILAKFKGNPLTAGKRKKILFYGHYDVIGAERENGKWNTDPFSLEGINDYLYGRGASDNKGPIMAAIYAVAELVAEKSLDSDIVFLIEGEEECGSRGFEQAVRANKQHIGHVDCILLANSYWLDDHTPCLTYGLRGVIHGTVEIRSPHPDLHSGVDGSSLLDESLKDLVMLLSKLTGKNGGIKIPGFSDAIPPLSEEEEHLYQDITWALMERNPALGDPHELARELQKRWREPSLTIHRFHTSGPENSTIIPKLARVSLSLRLVPNQEAQEVGATLVKFMHDEFDKLESQNDLTVTIDHMAEPWLGDFNNEIFQTLEEAVVEAWMTSSEHLRRRSSTAAPKIPQSAASITKPSPTTSSMLASGSMTPPPESSLDDVEEEEEATTAAPKSSYFPSQSQRRRPLYIREGGSIPAIRFLEKEFDAPAAQLPCGQASDSAHLDNERLRLVNLYKSKDIFKKVFKELPRR
jgi:di- and tripeptidase